MPAEHSARDIIAKTIDPLLETDEEQNYQRTDRITDALNKAGFVILHKSEELQNWGAGEPDQWREHGHVMLNNTRYPLIYGQYPHSRSDNRHYIVLAGEPTGFSGHRVLLDVSLTSNNYLKDSELSGNEIRKSGTGKILADRQVVYEFFFREIDYALLQAYQLISQLREHSSGWLSNEQRAKLVGRKLYYREIPAVVQRLITDQGCLILATASGAAFPAPIWHDEDDYDEAEFEVKVDVLDPHIWWFRR